MTFQETLRTVLRSAEAPSQAVFGHDDVQDWPEGALEALLQIGLLREASTARAVVCDGCEEACLADVEMLDIPGSPPRAYVICDVRDDIGRIELPLEKLKRWEVDFLALAKWIAQELGASGGVEESVLGRLWWLGRAATDRQRIDVFLATGATWSDTSTVFRSGRLQECSGAVVMVPSDVPTESPFRAGAKTVSLVRLLVTRGEHLHLDRSEFERLAGKGRARRSHAVDPIAVPPGTTWRQVVIEFMHEELVKIECGPLVEHRTFAHMGFRDWRKTGEQPDELWSHLRTLASRKGEIGWSDDFDVPQRNRYKVKQWVHDIRARLKACFPSIPGDPFEDYRRVKVYKTKFTLRGYSADR